MELEISVSLHYGLSAPTTLLLDIEPSSDAGQTCLSAQVWLENDPAHRALRTEAGQGSRRWIAAQDSFHCQFEARIALHRQANNLATCHAQPLFELPADVVPYLFPSRFCHSEQFEDFVSAQFGTQVSGAMVAAMADWIFENFRYNPAVSFSGTTATDSFHAMAGVCRDYAHVLITFARAAGIPARFVSVYGASVDPQDFHAVAEVWLDSAWHVVDPTRMTRPDAVVRINSGRDAADVAFLTSYGPLTFIAQSVHVTEAQR